MFRTRLAPFLLLGLLAAASLAAASETSVSMISDPGDYVGRGQTYSFDPSTAVFTPQILNSGNGAQVFVNSGNFTSWWYFNFGAPSGQRLAVGTYVGATRYLGFGDTPGIDVYGNGAGCNQQAGAFQVKQLTIENGTLTKLWVRFEQHCEGAAPALTGDLRYNADVSVIVNAPFGKKIAIGQTVMFGVTANSVAGDPVTITAEDLPQGATFDGSTFSWSPAKEQIGSHSVAFVGTAASGQDRSVTVIEVAERPLTGDTSLRMVSDQGDYIGQGQTWNYGAADGAFTGYSQTENVARLSFRNDQDDWDLEFAALRGDPLIPGFYRDARRYPFNDTSPGLDVSGNGRGCNMLSGDFEVKQLVVSGTTVTRFWARFEQHCEMGPPALAGEIRLNADVTVAVLAPFRARLQSGLAGTVNVSGVANAGGHVTLRAEGLPSGAQFEDLGNNTGRLTWTPSISQRGPYEVVFVGDDGLGHQDRSTTLVEVTGETSLALDSEAGEPLLRGEDEFFGPDAGIFNVISNFYDNSVRFTFNTPDYRTYWDVTLGAAGNAVLTPGNYEGATSSPGNDRPYMQVAGNGAGCSRLNGRFVVRQVEYGPDRSMKSFWATFEERCEGSATPLRGELRYNATVITDVTAPAADTLGPGEHTAFTVTSRNAEGRHVVLTTSGLPEGAGFVDHGDGTGTFAWTPLFAQIGNYVVTFIGDDGAGGVDSASTRVVVPGETSLRFESSPDGPMHLTPEDGTFSGSLTPEKRVHVEFAFDQRNGWVLDFGAPQNGVLESGFYPGASVEQLTGYSAPVPTYPVLRVFDKGGVRICYPTTGLFLVKQLEYGSSGAIESFWATFEEGEACPDETMAIGEVRYNARIEVAVRAPLRREVAPGQPLEMLVRAEDRLARHVALSATGLPEGALFQDRGDNTGTLTWTPGLDAIGLHDVTFVGDNGSGGLDRASTHIRVTGQSRLVIDSDAKDPVAGGHSGTFTPANGPFIVGKNDREGVSLNFSDKSTADPYSWFVAMAAPHTTPLAPGLYQPVSPIHSYPYDLAGLTVVHAYDPCSNIDGKFEIQEIEYGPGVEITSLRATFERLCIGAGTTLRGELRWNYDAPVMVHAPARIDTSEGSLVRFDVTTQVRDGSIALLSGTGLPSGALFTDHHDNTGTLEWATTAQQGGDYTVAFHARTAAGVEDSAVTTIHLRHENRAPVVRTAFTSPVVPGVPVTFDGSASYDLDGDALYHTWYFLDDTTLVSGATVPHTFTRSGTFPVVHGVSDFFSVTYAETLVHVQAVLPARAFAEGGNAVVRPTSGKPTTCVRIEPRDAAWALESAVLSSISMVSAGTGSVDRISALLDKTQVDKDTDRNGIAEIVACFAKGDLEQLFNHLSGRTTVQVALEGELVSGDLFRGTMDLPVVAKAGNALAASALPTGGLHGYRLTFVTTQPGSIQVRLFDVTGRSIRTLVDLDQAQAGAHDVRIDRADLPSGVYFYRIVTPEGVADGKLVLLQ